MSLRYAALMAFALAISGCGTSERDVTFCVPSMTCPKGCFPTVKETLEKQPGVQAVALYPQTKAGEIDDHRVRVSLHGAFDAQKAIAALAAEGFDGATVEQEKPAHAP